MFQHLLLSVLFVFNGSSRINFVALFVRLANFAQMVLCNDKFCVVYRFLGIY